MDPDHLKVVRHGPLPAATAIPRSYDSDSRSDYNSFYKLKLQNPRASFEEEITDQSIGDELHPNDADEEGGGRLRHQRHHR